MPSIHELPLGNGTIVCIKVTFSETRAKQVTAMTLLPLINAPFAIQLHVAFALSAVILGPLVLWRRSRDKWHRYGGYFWVLAMLGTAASSFWISESPMLGPFGLIHVLSAFTLFGLWQGVSAARAGDIRAHQHHMKNLYFWAMGVAGLFTFLPGRRMNALFSEVDPERVFVTAAMLIGTGLALFWYRQKRRVI